MSHRAIRPDPARIIVPRRHAQILIEPPFATLQAALTPPQSPAPATPRADAPAFAGQPLEPLRTAARAHFLQAATSWAQEIHAPPPPAAALEKPWIITGHQVEFYHAGVWAKALAAAELAKRVGGIAFDLLVDHDTVDDLGFDIPQRQADSWKRLPVHWAPASSIPADGLSAPTADQFAAWEKTLAGHPLAHTDTLAFILSHLARLSTQHSALSTPYVPWLSAARAAFERSLNIHIHHIPTSLLCTSDAWHAFVYAWIQNAESWTAAYNRHLAAYRQAHGIKNPHHPMPDLARTTVGDVTTCELPFWMYKLGEPRHRLFIRKSPSETTLLHDHTEHPVSVLSPQSSALLIRPRALTLTMYVRLFLADLFIHGIGGALYDQITDALLEDIFHAAPPYACVSAAWLLPLGQPLENSLSIPALKSRRHHLLHNPQLALDKAATADPGIAELLRARHSLIEQISASLASARRDKPAIAQRREWFNQLHAANASLHHQAPRLLADLDHQIQKALLAREQNKVLLWREYFFGLHTTESLKQLVAKVRMTSDK